jgi:hypothetical protein
MYEITLKPCREPRRNASDFSKENFKGRIHLEDLVLDWRIMLELILEK